MLTRDERVKILDFGLAKLAPTGSTGSTGAEGSQRAAETGTFPGAVLGTVGYMSPEQAKGVAVDYRSDQFSFGSVLYEMATGKRAFHGKSAVDTLAAIINQEPEPIEKTRPAGPGPPALDRRAMPRQGAGAPLRLDAGPGAGARDPSAITCRRCPAPSAGLRAPAGLASRACSRRRPCSPASPRIVFAWGTRRREAHPRLPAPHLPPRRGLVRPVRARRPHDRLSAPSRDRRPASSRRGRTVATRAVSSCPTPSVSRCLAGASSWALSLGRNARPRPSGGRRATGNDRRGPGRRLVSGRAEPGRRPQGRGKAPAGVSDREGALRDAGTDLRHVFGAGFTGREADRFPRLARGKSDVSVEVVDLDGGHRVLSRRFKRSMRLAWSPDGSELWFTVKERGLRMLVFAVTLKGEERPLLRLPSWVFLQDVARDGRVLVTLAPQQTRIWARSPGDARERDLSWHEGSLRQGPDARREDAALRRGRGGKFPRHLRAAHGRLARQADRRGKVHGDLSRRPMGGLERQRQRVGNGASSDRGREPVVLDSEGQHFVDAAFFPDGKRILFGQDDGPDFVKDLPNGKVRALSPGISACAAISPDGKEAVCNGPVGDRVRYAFDAGTYRPIPGLADVKGEVLKWSADGKSLFIGQFDALPLKIVRFDMAAGKAELWRELEPGETITPYEGLYYFTMTPDGQSYAYSWNSSSSDLYLVTGLR